MIVRNSRADHVIFLTLTKITPLFRPKKKRSHHYSQGACCSSDVTKHVFSVVIIVTDIYMINVDKFSSLTSIERQL